MSLPLSPPDSFGSPPMASKIGTETGIEAARGRWNEAVLDDDPELEGKAWPNKLAATLETLVDGHNETIDALEQIRRDLLLRPFG